MLNGNGKYVDIYKIELQRKITTIKMNFPIISSAQ